MGGVRNLAKPVPKPQKQKPPRSVRTECAQLGVSVRKDSECGEAFAPFCARMPLPFGEISKNPFRKRGSLSCFLLVPFLCRSKEKYTRAAFLSYLSFAEAKESRKHKKTSTYSAEYVLVFYRLKNSNHFDRSWLRRYSFSISAFFAAQVAFIFSICSGVNASRSPSFSLPLYIRSSTSA